MADGRMLNRSISKSKKIARLIESIGPVGGLIITWMIPYLDREGRMLGDPDVIKGEVFPRCSGVTPDLVRETLKRAHELRIIQWYEDEKDQYVEFPGFAHNQPHMRKDRERESSIPSSTCADCRSVSGVSPELVRSESGKGPPKRSEVEENKEENKKEINKERSPPMKTDPLEQEIEIVAKHFAAVHPELRRQADKRSNRSKIRARLTERLGDLPPYTAQELCDAIDGNAEDPWHCDVRKHDLEYVLRDTEHVDKFVAIKKLGPGRPQSEYTESSYERAMRRIEEHNARVDASKDSGLVHDPSLGLGAYLPAGKD